MELKDKLSLKQMKCQIRGCPNNAYVLYNGAGGNKIPLCLPCARRMSKEADDISYKLFQLNYANNWIWDGERKRR